MHRGANMPGSSRLGGYEQDFASSILLDEDGDRLESPSPTDPKQPLYSFDGSPSPFFYGAGAGSAPGTNRPGRLMPPHHRGDGDAPNRTPTRTPSPVYHWSSLKAPTFNDGAESFSPFQAPPGKSSSSTSTGLDQQAFPQLPFSPMFPPPNPFWAGSLNPQAQAAHAAQAAQAAQAAYYAGMMINGPGMFNSQAGPGLGGNLPPEGKGGPSPGMESMMMAAFRAGDRSSAGPLPPGPASLGSHDRELQERDMRGVSTIGGGQPMRIGLVGSSLDGMGSMGSMGGGLGGCMGTSGPPSASPMLNPAGGSAESSRRTKSRNKDRELALAPGPRQPGQIEAPLAMNSSMKGATPASSPGGKGDRKKRGGNGGAALAVADSADDRGNQGGSGAGGKSRPVDNRQQQQQISSSPIVEQLKAKERTVELSEMALHISEIAIDQYGSRLIQQKLEVASDEEKQVAFKCVLQKMNHLTTDVFGNYVIQKFFEYGNAEQRRILAEQLVGQVLKLSMQMYGCRVVQKALDYVPIEQQVLLIGELKGHVLKCVEDQHGNHVIQKCIERLPTDRIGFIVESFSGQAARMAKHCYGCRVIQRLIEYCASQQISALLEEVLRNCPELATDQYGNYVVQHVMEHSSRPGDRQMIMSIVRKNVLSLSCHKYASNVIEKALACATVEERGALVNAIIGESPDSTHGPPPLHTMMRDRFGNYIVQRVIALAQGPYREALMWKLHEQMPALKKSNTYGKHIISALERAQTGRE